MQIDFSAYEGMLAVLQGRLPLETALAHPAYRVVFAHAARYFGGLETQDVASALRGEESRFYGMKDLRERLERIRQLAAVIAENQQAWLAAAARELAHLLPEENLEPIRIYPILGYDMGIGFNQTVCMNLNVMHYLDQPLEFFYYLIHESAHVLYERHHPIPSMAEVRTPADWRAYFSLWTQNEGFATYSALRIRQQDGQMNDEDYRVLSDPERLRNSLEIFRAVRAKFDANQLSTDQEFIESTFGDQRIVYRAGCQIFRNIEAADGLAAVRQAWLCDAGEFIARYAVWISPA